MPITIVLMHIVLLCFNGAFLDNIFKGCWKERKIQVELGNFFFGAERAFVEFPERELVFSAFWFSTSSCTSNKNYPTDSLLHKTQTLTLTYFSKRKKRVTETFVYD